MRRSKGRYGVARSTFLALLAVIGCATQEENGDMPQGGAGTSTSGSTSGGSSSGSGGGGGKAMGGSSSGSGSTQAGTSSGGSPGAGTGGADDGGSAGMSMGGAGGSGGAGGKAGAGGSAGGGGKGGAGGTAGSGGKGGSGGSGGATPVDTCKNGKADGDETDVDCGGKVCTARCATNKGCDLVTDCVQTSGHVCDEDTCHATGCNAGTCSYALTRVILGSTAARGQAFVTWDSDSLDIEIQLLDATPRDDSANNWEDDSVEIYLDLNNGGTAAYEAANDFQITVPRAAGALSGTANYTQASIVVNRSSDATSYTLEISIPWNALNGAASPVGNTIGFDIGVNDDTGAGDASRDGQLMIYGNDQNYQNTSAFGDLVLTP